MIKANTCFGGDHVCHREVFIHIDQVYIHLEKDVPPVVEDFTALTLNGPPLRPFSFNLEKHGFFWILFTDIGITVLWDEQTRVYVRLSTQYAGTVCGLCGNFDMAATNDLATRSGASVTSEVEFGNSWRVPFSCPMVKSTALSPCVENPDRLEFAQQKCAVLLEHPGFMACHLHVDPAYYFELCKVCWTFLKSH